MNRKIRRLQAEIHRARTIASRLHRGKPPRR
jgi:hypothetical protein